MKFWVYILHCSNGTYYVGHTDDPARRLKEHRAGKGAEHTRKYRPVVLVHKESFETEISAMRREAQIKHWSHAKKEALIAGDLAELKKLAKRHIK